MTPIDIDSARPGKKKKDAARKKTNRLSGRPKKQKKIPNKPKELDRIVKTKEATPLSLPKISRQSQMDERQKRKLLWLSVGSAMIIIFFGWLIIFPYSNDRTNKTGNSQEKAYLKRVGQQLEDIWNKFTADISKIRNKSQGNKNSNSDNNDVKKLEKKVFPQFENPQRQ